MDQNIQKALWLGVGVMMILTRQKRKPIKSRF